ncbi:hypothetical protein HYH03_013525 [Edaphochlamys debaryana]|uniref:C-type lectin domain-containing protein n=1 Tax=Edaphochlamys debaryana TaxID=47281 RepID=A0A836BSX3_9CHLO|nr:hypothetical protein HYH03_013525 [Edaphochlamys debaryana]|eukprot:KAG2487946.1 hypothetical protein HYH03_013525 [Edaphochlamys debaryana]
MLASNGDTLSMYDIRLNWDQAETFCQRRGGSLASFRDQAELGRFSLGIGDYFNLRGRSSIQNSRRPNWPSVWTGLSSRRPSTGPLASGVRNAQLVATWRGNEYMWIPFPMLDFEQARAYCQSFSGDLAVLSDPGDVTALMNMLRSPIYVRTGTAIPLPRPMTSWVGLQQLNGSSSWTWVNGAGANITVIQGTPLNTSAAFNIACNGTNCTTSYRAFDASERFGVICSRPTTANG